MKTKKGYMCSVAFDCELGETDVEVYASIEDLKAERGCANDMPGSCGIYEVEIKITKVIQEERIFDE